MNINNELNQEKNKKKESVEEFYKNEGAAIFVKGRMIYGIHPDNLNNFVKVNGDLKIKFPN
ncbi:hypothetical protein [Bacillus subtilis]|uniref:hypothetical protein n=1 Tax=Bacillus subtilis TaxID=1423 RepID=UPI002DBACC16|nr:hypothetical protein [Bacillus subtilis]MEC3664041.1 hypothetical protein [Bacillus subtilis]